jgi:hypothetical protein
LFDGRSRHHYEKKACVYTGVTGTVRTATFTRWNAEGVKEQLIAAGVKISGPGATVAQDLEPEFTTFSEDESIAFVSLQVGGGLSHGVKGVQHPTVAHRSKLKSAAQVCLAGKELLEDLM